MDYNKTAIIAIPATMSTAGIIRKIVFPDSYLVKKIWLVVRVEGAETTNTVTLTSASGAAVYATLAIGTSAVGTVISADVAEDDRARAAESLLEVRSTVNDASAVADVYVLVAHNE